MPGLLSENPFPYGMPIDPKRKMVEDPDNPGSFMTEQTITIQADIGEGPMFYNIPTVINGEKVSDRSAYAFFINGMNPHVGVFKSETEALESAQMRTKMIDKIRQPGLLD